MYIYLYVFKYTRRLFKILFLFLNVKIINLNNIFSKIIIYFLTKSN